MEENLRILKIISMKQSTNYQWKIVFEWRQFRNMLTVFGVCSGLATLLLGLLSEGFSEGFGWTASFAFALGAFFLMSISAFWISSNDMPCVDRRASRARFACSFLCAALSSSRIGGTNDLQLNNQIYNSVCTNVKKLLLYEQCFSILFRKIRIKTTFKSNRILN